MLKEWSPLTISLAAGAAIALTLAATLVYLRLRRRKDPVELERLRRLFLAHTGRIATGETVGLVEPEGQNPPAVLLLYRYDVAGVTYEVAQDVAALPAVAAQAGYIVGRPVNVKYEMKQPGNSIVVSERWSGLPDIQTGTDAVPRSEDAEKQD